MVNAAYFAVKIVISLCRNFEFTISRIEPFDKTPPSVSACISYQTLKLDTASGEAAECITEFQHQTKS